LFFGGFDVAAVLALVALNVWILRRHVRVHPLPFFLIVVPLFALVLPALSIGFETDHYMKEVAGPVVDSWETAYTLFRLPEYWAAGLVQAVVFVYGRRHLAEARPAAS
jgi:hypothetical protein